MADSEEHCVVYQRAIDHCHEYQFKGLWSRLKQPCDVWEATYDEGGARTVSDTRKSEHGKPHKYGDDAAARSLTIR